MYETHFNLVDLKVQVGQFFAIVNSRKFLLKGVGKLKLFLKKYGQKLLLTEVLNSVKLLLVMPAIKATNGRYFFRNERR